MPKLMIFDADKAQDLFYWMEKLASDGDLPDVLLDAWETFDPVPIPQDTSLVNALWKIGNDNHY